MDITKKVKESGLYYALILEVGCSTRQDAGIEFSTGDKVELDLVAFGVWCERNKQYPNHPIVQLSHHLRREVNNHCL